MKKDEREARRCKCGAILRWKASKCRGCRMLAKLLKATNQHANE
jgi:ribosomal protein L40E